MHQKQLNPFCTKQIIENRLNISRSERSMELTEISTALKSNKVILWQYIINEKDHSKQSNTCTYILKHLHYPLLQAIVQARQKDLTQNKRMLEREHKRASKISEELVRNRFTKMADILNDDKCRRTITHLITFSSS